MRETVLGKKFSRLFRIGFSQTGEKLGMLHRLMGMDAPGSLESVWLGTLLSSTPWQSRIVPDMQWPRVLILKNSRIG